MVRKKPSRSEKQPPSKVVFHPAPRDDFFFRPAVRGQGFILRPEIVEFFFLEPWMRDEIISLRFEIKPNLV